MKVGTLVGLLLIVAGAIGLIWGGITYTKNRETVGIGPLEVTATEKETIPIGPIAGGILPGEAPSRYPISLRQEQAR